MADNKTFRLVTFQDKYILDLFEIQKRSNKKQIYIQENNYFRNIECNLLQKFITEMKTKLGIPEDRFMLPIWCWVVPKSQELTDEYILELYSRSVPKCGRIVLLELEVPKNFVLLSNYSVWEDLLFSCNITRNPDVKDEEFNKLFEKRKGSILQASLPFLSKDFIIKVKDYNNYLDRDYSNTDNEIKELQSKGLFLEG